MLADLLVRVEGLTPGRAVFVVLVVLFALWWRADGERRKARRRIRRHARALRRRPR